MMVLLKRLESFWMGDHAIHSCDSYRGNEKVSPLVTPLYPEFQDMLKDVYL